MYATARTPRSWDDDRVVPLELDVTDVASIDAAAERASDTTILINNAGILTGTPDPLDTDPADLRRLLETNTIGLFAVTRAFAGTLVRSHGAVVNVASVASWRAAPGLGAYAASKAAVWSLTDSIRRQLQDQGVQVLGLYLAFADTPLAAGVTADKIDPAEVIDQTYAGLEAGALEILADQRTRDVRATLSTIITP